MKPTVVGVRDRTDKLLRSETAVSHAIRESANFPTADTSPTAILWHLPLEAAPSAWPERVALQIPWHGDTL